MRRREQPMFRVRHVLAVAAAAVAAAGGTISAAQAATHKVTINVVGIDRTGAQVAVQSTVVPLAGNALPSSGPKYSVTPGTYFIGTSVPTYSSGALVSQTIVERRVRVIRGATIRLDARGGELVSVRLDGRDLGSPSMAGGCIRRGIGVVYPDPPAPQLYLQPVRAKGLGFDWAVETAGPSGSYYDLAGGTNNALPSSPVYRVHSSGLAKAVMQARADTVPDQTANVDTSATLSDGCSLQGLQTPPQIPFRVVDHRTPGFWRTEVATRHNFGMTTCSDTWTYRRYAARRSYLVSFENAAHGPSTAVPYVAGPSLYFDPNHQLIDPLTTGYEYCNVTNVRLSSGGHLLKKGRFTNLVGGFTARVRAEDDNHLAVQGRAGTGAGRGARLPAARPEHRQRGPARKPDVRESVAYAKQLPIRARPRQRRAVLRRGGLQQQRKDLAQAPRSPAQGLLAVRRAQPQVRVRVAACDSHQLLRGHHHRDHLPGLRNQLTSTRVSRCPTGDNLPPFTECGGLGLVSKCA